jgi:glycosyltransferase involved in cell wall biosynthesis
MTDMTPQETLGSVPTYLILPAYNEEKNIRSVLHQLSLAFPESHFRFHVVVNNSKDATYDNALQEAALDSRISVSNIPERIGKGGAILYGFSQVKEALFIGFIDADGSIVPEAVKRLLRAFEEDRHLDVAISSRWIKGSELAKKQSLTRQLSSRSFNLLIRLLFRFPYRDTQCGAKVLRYDAWQQIETKVREKSFAFDIDLLWQAKKAGLTIKEIAIPWHDTPGSSVSILQSAWPIVRSLFRIRYKK